MRCTNCKKEIHDWDQGTVFSAGDYDPYCNAACQKAHSDELHREMGLISNMTDQQFYDYMGVPGLNPTAPTPDENDNANPNWKEDGF